MNIKTEMLKIIEEFDKRASKLDKQVTIYIIGAGPLIIEGYIERATLDLDYIPESHGNIFQNVITESGIVSHLVPSGLTNMPAHWKRRAITLKKCKHIIVKIPDIYDRLIDKIVRGLKSDIDDVVQVTTKNKNISLSKLKSDIQKIADTEYRTNEEILNTFEIINHLYLK